MIKKCKVKPYAEKYICDKCKEGEMLPTGDNMWLSNPPKFLHKCNICGNEDTFCEKYPTVKFDIADE